MRVSLKSFWRRELMQRWEFKTKILRKTNTYTQTNVQKHSERQTHMPSLQWVLPGFVFFPGQHMYHYTLVQRNPNTSLWNRVSQVKETVYGKTAEKVLFMRWPHTYSHTHTFARIMYESHFHCELLLGCWGDEPAEGARAAQGSQIKSRMKWKFEINFFFQNFFFRICLMTRGMVVFLGSLLIQNMNLST